MSIRRLTLTVLVSLGALALSSAPALAAGEVLGLGDTFGSATSTPSDPELLSDPTGVAVNQGTGDVYVVDNGHNRVEYFSSTGEYLGQFNGSETPAKEFAFSNEDTSNIAVDNACYYEKLSELECKSKDPSSGDVYVMDSHHGVIDKFSSTGTYVGQIGAGLLDGVAVDSKGLLWVYQNSRVIDDFSDALANEFLSSRSSQAGGFVFPAFAVDSEDNLYAYHAGGADFRGGTAIAKLNSAGEVLGGEAGVEFGGVHGERFGIAVDLASNNVYLHYQSAIERPGGGSIGSNPPSVLVFSPSGSLIEQFSAKPLSGGSGIAVNSVSHRVYVAEPASNEVYIVERGSMTPVPSTGVATAVTGLSATLNGDLNPGGVTGGVGYYFSYNVAGSSCTGPGSVSTPFDSGGSNATGSADVPVSASVTGLEPKVEYVFCLVAEKFGSATGPAVPFMTGTAPPKIDEESAQPRTTKAELSAQINPEKQATTYAFEYARSEAAILKNEGTKVAGASALSAGFGDQLAQAEISGLTPSTVYYYRVVAVNTLNETTYGLDRTFETAPLLPPLVEGESSSEYAPLPQQVLAPVVTLSATIDPEFEETTYYFQYVDAAQYEEKAKDPYQAGASAPVPFGSIPGTSSQGSAVSVNLPELAGGTTYHYRVVAANPIGTVYGPDQKFTTRPPPPVVSTGAASEVTQTSANVTGTVNPETLKTSCYYQYGPSSEYGQTAPCVPDELGNGSSPVPALATLAPLTPGVTYHYRLVATNKEGIGYGQDETFTTVADAPPLVSTGPASGISVSGATISGTIDPREVQATYEFEYGTDASYGTQVSGTAFPEQGAQTVTLSLQGLQPNTTYHYRLVASNPDATVAGEDETFTTPGILDPLVFPVTAPLIVLPAIAFPSGSQVNTGKTETKQLSNAQKLRKALKACKKDKHKAKRRTCEKQAKAKYGPAKKKGKK
jgi:NHL repeat